MSAPTHTRPHLWSAGGVSNADFGYWRDGLRGRVAWITIKHYDEDVLRKVTLFDYENCSGHSVVFEEPVKGDSELFNVKRKNSFEEYDAESIMVPKGLKVLAKTG